MSKTMPIPPSLLSLCLLVLLSRRAAADTQCYAPDGKTLPPHGGFQACNKMGIHDKGVYSMCCDLDVDDRFQDTCDITGLCKNKNGTYFRDYCTDPTWDSPNCQKICIDDTKNGSMTDAVELTRCPNGSFCCGSDNTACCGTENAITLTTPGSSIATTTVTSSAGKPKSQEDDESESVGVAIVAGLGAALGIVCVLSGLVIWHLLRKLRREEESRSSAREMEPMHLVDTKPFLPPDSPPPPVGHGSGSRSLVGSVRSRSNATMRSNPMPAQQFYPPPEQPHEYYTPDPRGGHQEQQYDQHSMQNQGYPPPQQQQQAHHNQSYQHMHNQEYQQPQQPLYNNNHEYHQQYTYPPPSTMGPLSAPLSAPPLENASISAMTWDRMSANSTPLHNLQLSQQYTPNAQQLSHQHQQQQHQSPAQQGKAKKAEPPRLNKAIPPPPALPPQEGSNLSSLEDYTHTGVPQPEHLHALRSPPTPPPPFPPQEMATGAESEKHFEELPSQNLGSFDDQFNVKFRRSLAGTLFRKANIQQRQP